MSCVWQTPGSWIESYRGSLFRCSEWRTRNVARPFVVRGVVRGGAVFVLSDGVHTWPFVRSFVRSFGHSSLLYIWSVVFWNGIAACLTTSQRLDSTLRWCSIRSIDPRCDCVRMTRTPRTTCRKWWPTARTSPPRRCRKVSFRRALSRPRRPPLRLLVVVLCCCLWVGFTVCRVAFKLCDDCCGCCLLYTSDAADE